MLSAYLWTNLCFSLNGWLAAKQMTRGHMVVVHWFYSCTFHVPWDTLLSSWDPPGSDMPLHSVSARSSLHFTDKQTATTNSESCRYFSTNQPRLKISFSSEGFLHAQCLFDLRPSALASLTVSGRTVRRGEKRRAEVQPVTTHIK